MSDRPSRGSGGVARGGSRGDGADADAEAIEAGRLMFARECRFLLGVTRIADLPPADLPEVAFAGRSNVGKSSLLNALTRRKSLARTSNTPGRTREVNFFSLDDRLMLADLPGYGYARAPKSQVKGWTRLVFDYMAGRPSLRRLCLLIDARHGIKSSDEEVMTLLDQAAVSYQVILTKTDKIGETALEERLASMKRDLAKHVACHPDVIATSAVRGAGIPELRAALAALAD